MIILEDDAGTEEGKHSAEAALAQVKVRFYPTAGTGKAPTTESTNRAG